MTGDLTHLVITGKPEEVELALAWQKIIAEFSDLVKTEKSKALFNAWKNYISEDCKWRTSLVIHFVLEKEYVPELAQQLFLLGFDLIEKDDKDYKQKLEKTKVEINSLKLSSEQYKKEYEALSKSNGNSNAKALADFDGELTMLSKFMGYRIDKRLITLSEYASIINLYNDYIKSKSK